jgi:hypothetical protein
MNDTQLAPSGADTIVLSPHAHIVERDMGLLRAWLTIFRSPRAFFMRVGAQYGSYGHDAMVRAGRGPEPMFFYFVLGGLTLLVHLVVRFLMDADLLLLMTGIGLAVGLILGFYITAAIVRLVTRMLGFPGDFEAAKGVVGFQAAVWPPMMALPMMPVLPAALVGLGLMVYAGALLWMALRFVFGVSAVRATLAWVVLSSLQILWGIIAGDIMGM